MSDFSRGHFDRMVLFCILPFCVLLLSGRVTECCFLDFQNFLQKKCKKKVLFSFLQILLFFTLFLVEGQKFYTSSLSL
jgi:hypothetical protein